MTFRKVEMVCVECDGGCGHSGPPRRNQDHADAAAQASEIPITPIAFNPAGRHLCADCRASIAKEQK